MRNANHIIHQKIALLQMQQAIVFCYLQILRRFLINYKYDATGRLQTKTDAKGQTIAYTYDDAGRMIQIVQTDANGNAKTIGFTYDDAGNLLTYGDGATSATYTYDNLNRKTQETVNYGSFSLTTGYSYNQNGTKKTFTYPNGTVIDYAYDPNNQIAGINISDAGYITIGNYQWTRPTSITLPGGGKREFNYDALMRTQAITGKDPNQNTLLNYSYGFDKMDNIKQRNTQAGNYAYNYDDLYRLNEVQKDTQSTEAYTYDPVGNRLTSQATTGNWNYDANNELISAPPSSGSTGGTTYAYDQNGNTTQRNINGVIQNYVYDVDNRLTEVRDASNNLIATYTYDPFGRRIKKTVSGGALSPSGGGSGEVYYLYSDEGLIGEYDATGNEIKTYGYKPNSTWSTDPIFMKQGTSYYFYHNDHLGTPQKMTDISGAVVWSATYDAFGKASVDAGSTITNNLRFPGQYFDAETGWHYNLFRYYDSGTGRYVAADPIGFAGGDKNLYRHVKNNPINWIDPLGLSDCSARCYADAVLNLGIGLLANEVPGLAFILMVSGLNIPTINLFQGAGGCSDFWDADITGLTQAGVAGAARYYELDTKPNKIASRLKRLAYIGNAIDFIYKMKECGKKCDDKCK